MTELRPTLELFLVAWAIFLAMGSAAAAVFVRGIRGRLERWAPATRHRALLSLAGLPWAISGLLMLAATLPSLLADELPGIDHCLTHDDRHHHLCFTHLSTNPMNTPAEGFLLVLAALALLAVARSGRRVWRASQLARSLRLSGEHHPELDVTLVDTPLPLCVAAGLRRPHILISRSLLHALEPGARAVMLAHERAHVRRRDALFNSLARFLTTAHLPGVRRWLLEELEVAAEQACDEEAGDVVGDRLAVASAILAVQRAALHCPMNALAPVAVAFVRHTAERRLASLLTDPLPPGCLRHLSAVAGTLALAALAVGGKLHHVVESLLFRVAY